MTVVIEDYSDNFSTEPMYISECLRRIGLGSDLWNRSVSLAEFCKSKNPSLIILKGSKLTEETVKFLSGLKTEVVLNCSGLDRDGVTTIIKELLNNKVKLVCLFGENIPMVTVKGLKLVNLNSGVDLFSGIGSGEKDFSFPECIVVNDNRRLPKVSGRKHYHTISLFEHTDIVTQVIHLPKVLKCYDKVTIIHGNQGESQLLLDSIYYGKNVTIFDQHWNQITIDISRKRCSDRVSRLFEKMGFNDLSSKIREGIYE